MAIDRIVQMIFRAAELAFAAIVTGITGAISMVFALVWLLPFSGSFVHWPMDIFISILWFVSFGLLVNLIGDGCGPVFDWSNVSPRGDDCGRHKANIAFTFLSAIVWLASALIGLFWVRRRTAVADNRPAVHRRRWYNSRV
uniref:Integral membrane protein n=1 Tax=Colletotrichum fructicola (strain Nara gc5) TaxID=1213859 RepID=L2FQI8_COLFN